MKASFELTLAQVAKIQTELAALKAAITTVEKGEENVDDFVRNLVHYQSHIGRAAGMKRSF